MPSAPAGGALAGHGRSAARVVGEAERPVDEPARAGRVAWRGDGVELAVHGRHIDRAVVPECGRAFDDRPGLGCPANSTVGRDRRQPADAADGVDRAVWAERRGGRLTARPEVDRPHHARLDALLRRLERVEGPLGSRRAAVRAEADVNRPVASDRRRGVPRGPTLRVEAPGCRELVAAADRVAQGEEGARVHADIGGAVGCDGGRALEVVGGKGRVAHVDVGDVEGAVEDQAGRAGVRAPTGVLCVDLVHRSTGEGRRGCGHWRRRRAASSQQQHADEQRRSDANRRWGGQISHQAPPGVRLASRPSTR